MCLHVLKAHSFKRILVLIERDCDADASSFASIVNVQALSAVTNITIHRIDLLLSGYYGIQFTDIKREFDTITDGPIALLSYGMETKVLVGTNFDYVDAIVTLGKLPLQNLTQALARTFRPRATRDNSKSIVMIKLHH